MIQHPLKKEAKIFDLSCSSDIFWANNVGNPFPKIAVEIKSYLTEYEGSLAEFNKISGGVDLDHYDESQLLGRTKDLGSFVNTIPQMREKKRVIDTHTNIATALLKEIKARELDTYFSLEESIKTRSLMDKKELLAVLSDPSRGTIEDKMRLFLIYYMANENMSSSELEQYEKIFKGFEVNLNVLKYLKKTKAFNDSFVPSNPSPSVSSLTVGSTMRSLIQKVNMEPFVGALGGELTNQMTALFNAGVKALSPSTKELPITKIVDSIMEMKNDFGVDGYHYLDPKLQRKSNQGIPRKNTPYKEAIVFVVGGGNYVEYLNLQEYAKKQPTKKIIYGSSEILSSKEFLEQLSELATKST